MDCTGLNRRFILITVAYLLLLQASAAPDKLTKDTRAPINAIDASGFEAIARTLGVPHLRAAGQTPAHTSLLKPGSPPGRPPSNSAAGAASQPVEDGVTREETSSFKEVNGETIRVVEGSYGYDSPEGIPISVKYMSDENGNKASFTIGKAAGGGGGGGGSKPKPGGGGAGGGSGGAKGGGGGGGGGKMYLPPK